ncbi:hypothetical protein [Streptomyces mirabilis]|uniref:Uncharacterized protein n=1 Tax=Streptomyces mirabilis TaxID=68239 RepID=A0ABU3UHW9_9ACTN|nr:hypothetical protein [Streptomyces mirabilis]MDU8993456.1 hypothetical protein [Streptomyces mirabilis]MDU9001870.1 hypothetical protein [Streptomyces mirabilis]
MTASSIPAWFLLPGENAQSEYEMLRSHLLEHGRMPYSLAAARFARRGLAGLISWPSGERDFRAEVSGARRPAWTPHHDPRLDVLAAVFEVLLDVADHLEPKNDQWQRWAR